MPELKPISEIEKELYEVLADKTLSFGCKFLYKKEWQEDILTFTCSYWDTGNTTTVQHLWKEDASSEINGFSMDECEIIGHEPTLASVIQFFCKKYKRSNIVELLDMATRAFNGHKSLLERMPECGQILDLFESFNADFGLDNQSEDTLRKLHSLICKK